MPWKIIKYPSFFPLGRFTERSFFSGYWAKHGVNKNILWSHVDFIQTWITLWVLFWNTNILLSTNCDYLYHGIWRKYYCIFLKVTWEGNSYPSLWDLLVILAFHFRVFWYSSVIGISIFKAASHQLPLEILSVKSRD